jgi:hypothetical protein
VTAQPLVQRWRVEAEVLRRRGAEAQAVTLESAAGELEAWEREAALQALTLEEASLESGLTYSALEKGVRSGRIPNAGEKNRPRIRRCDLPRKPSRQNPRPTGEPDLAGRILGQG